MVLPLITSPISVPELYGLWLGLGEVTLASRSHTRLASASALGLPQAMSPVPTQPVSQSNVFTSVERQEPQHHG